MVFEDLGRYLSYKKSMLGGILMGDGAKTTEIPGKATRLIPTLYLILTNKPLAPNNQPQPHIHPPPSHSPSNQWQKSYRSITRNPPRQCAPPGVHWCRSDGPAAAARLEARIFSSLILERESCTSQRPTG
ncbi:optic atrophy 3 protein [Striga asiatica]|uniref:Optic atrophy 3 protein n=1 Tax=Striga asiatica TaxID=4170 RepID=A0A5A7PPB4_STRAF|nr:optic atrophy 3 protein [Striga asiatica]